MMELFRAYYEKKAKKGLTGENISEKKRQKKLLKSLFGEDKGSRKSLCLANPKIQI